MPINKRKWKVGDRVRYTSQDGAITDATVQTVCATPTHLFVVADEFKTRRRPELYGCHVNTTNVVYLAQ